MNWPVAMASIEKMTGLYPLNRCWTEVMARLVCSNWPVSSETGISLKVSAACDTENQHHLLARL